MSTVHKLTLTPISDGVEYAIWQRKARSELNKNAVPFERTLSGLAVKALYTSDDIAGLPHLDSLPGAAPFLRGPKSTMYVTHPWTVRQYSGFSTAEETNQFFRTSLQSGQKGISIAFDLPTHRGYDSTEREAVADVGKAGVAIDTVEDMKVLLEGINLNTVSVSMTMNGAVLPVMACYLVAAEELGFEINRLTGTIQNDILKEFIARNTYIHDPAFSMRIVGDTVQFLRDNVPKFNPISISGYHLQEAGADAVTELAFTFGNAIEYLKEIKRRNVDIDKVASRISFFFAVGIDFYVEIAKLRAARVLWHDIATMHGCVDDSSKALRMHCQTSGVSLTNQKPLNNIVRTSIEALAAVFGGTQSLHTNSYDEAICIPTAAAADIARDTQLIIQNETGITATIDPWAGSYMIESLTSQLIDQARAMLHDIHSLGGMLNCINTGWATQKILDTAVRTQASIDSGERRIVGVNCFTQDDAAEGVPARRKIVHEDVLAVQSQRLAATKLARNELKVHKALEDLSEGALTDTNLMRLCIIAVKVRASVGEISAALTKGNPRYRVNVPLAENVYLKHHGDKARLDRAIVSVSNFREKTGRPPKVFIGKCGQDGHDRGLKIVASGLADLGFNVVISALFDTSKEIVSQAKQAEVDVIGISSLAGAHLEIARSIVQEKVKAGLTIPVIMGGVIPRQDFAALTSLGISAVLTPGTPIDICAVTILKILQNGGFDDEQR